MFGWREMEQGEAREDGWNISGPNIPLDMYSMEPSRYVLKLLDDIVYRTCHIEGT